MKMKNFSDLATVFYDDSVERNEGEENAPDPYKIDRAPGSREAAITQIKKYLEDIDYWKQNLPMMQHGTHDFLAVSYPSNYKKTPCTISLVIPSYAYVQGTGIKCFKSAHSVHFKKTLANYFSIEQGLFKFCLDLLGTEAKKSFIEKYGDLGIVKITSDVS